MTHSSTDPEAFFEEWLLAYDSMLVDDLTATLPSSSQSDPARNAELHKAQICLQLLELDRLSLDADASNSKQSTRKSERSTRIPPSGTRSSENDDARQRFQRFQLIRRLGMGGFGIVFLAEDPTLKRLVAIKVPRPESLATESRRKRFIEESRLVASLDHPHIVPIHEAGTFGPFCYQVLAYCSAGSLADWLRRKFSTIDSSPSEEEGRNQRVLSEDEAIRLMCLIVEAVQHAHEHGVLHCDLKPSNILLVQGRELGTALSGAGHPGLDDDIQTLRPMISDFGLARVLIAEPPNSDALELSIGPRSRTSQTTLAGSLPYMAPEQCLTGLGAISERSDVFSLGAILYELLAGRPPFDDSLEARSLGSRPPPLRQIRSSLSRVLESIVLRALEPLAEDRFGSAKELLVALQSSRDPEHRSQPLPSGRAPRPSWLSALRITMWLGFLALIVCAGQLFLAEPIWGDRATSLAPVAVPDEGVEFSSEGNVFHTPLEYDGQSPVTIELWCRPQAPKGFMLSWCGLISLSSDNGQRWAGPTIGVLPSEHEIIQLCSQSPLSTKRWHHLAVVYDGQRFGLFVDGQPQEMAYTRETDAGIREIPENPAITLTPIWPDLGLTIGSNAWGSSAKHRYPYHGAIREIRLSTGVRYHEAFTPQTSMIVDSETLALYRFTPQSASIIDESGKQPPLSLVPQPHSKAW